MLFTCGWGWYVVEMCLWPNLGVEVRCVNFCDGKIYSSWPGANGAEVGEMGHPAQGRGICVDNARCLEFLKSCKMGVFWVIKCALSVNVRLSKLILEVRLWRGYWCWVKVGHGEWGGWSMLFTCGWGWYVVEMCLWPILGVEVRRCANFCDEKIYSSWPGANGAEVGEMGHPAQGRGICVDNARCFRIFEKLQNGGVLSN